MVNQSLIPISPLSLSSQFPVGVDVYSWQTGSKEQFLFLAADETATDDALQRILSSHDVKLYINKYDSFAFQNYLRSHFDEWFKTDSISIQNKAALLSEIVRNVLSEQFSRNETNSVVTSAKTLGSHIAQLTSNRTLSGSELCQILHHDYGTSTHSANVGFYCSLLASHMGYTGEKLEEIATGALLHDLGKLEIDERILNKPGKLDEFEFRTIKEHPLTGFRKLIKAKGVTTDQLLMAYQHHERLDGKGYPVGIGGSEIDIVSRICSVADVFDAMTSNRPYRRALSQKQTLEIMNEGVNKSFDKEVFQCWSNIAHRRLSN
ncbi:MAG TPA: HD domain-containing phosphohydrolase [Pirellula sp.]|nr:HD domain-containing phosphohydrolase [Pirellula sp.]